MTLDFLPPLGRAFYQVMPFKIENAWMEMDSLTLTASLESTPDRN